MINKVYCTQDESGHWYVISIKYGIVVSGINQIIKNKNWKNEPVL